MSPNGSGIMSKAQRLPHSTRQNTTPSGDLPVLLRIPQIAIDAGGNSSTPPLEPADSELQTPPELSAKAEPSAKSTSANQTLASKTNVVPASKGNENLFEHKVNDGAQ